MSATNPKDSSRIRGDARARRAQRQQEAIERQATYDALAPEDRMARIEKRPGGSAKEKAKVLHAIEKRGKVKK